MWLDAEEHPTKGFAFRKGFHCTLKPIAPHLSTKNRCWVEVEIEDGEVSVTTAMEDFGTMQKKLEELQIVPTSANLERIPLTTNDLPVDSARKVLRLVELLEDDDDVQAVYHNLELSEELISEL